MTCVLSLAAFLLGCTPADQPPAFSSQDITPVADIVYVLEDVGAATSLRFHAVDEDGVRLDGLKVIEEPAGGYLGVSHADMEGSFHLRLSRSDDLMTWHFAAELDEHAGMPDLDCLADGSFLLVYEKDSPGQAWVRFRHYPNRTELLAARYDREKDVPRNLGLTAEGTPSIETVRWGRDVDATSVEIGLHYFEDVRVDRLANGRLDGFDRWTIQRDPLDERIRALGIKDGIGDRDDFTIAGHRYLIVEAREEPGDWATWRLVLHDRGADRLTRLRPRTPGGSRSFSNPSVTVLAAPSGRRALFAHYFLPHQGAAPGEAGPLIFFKEL